MSPPTDWILAQPLPNVAVQRRSPCALQEPAEGLAGRQPRPWPSREQMCMWPQGQPDLYFLLCQAGELRQAVAMLEVASAASLHRAHKSCLSVAPCES